MHDGSNEQPQSHEKAGISIERQLETERLELMSQLDDEQQAAFEAIFNPDTQAKLEAETDSAHAAGADTPTMTSRFGLLPREMTPIQHSVFAMIEAFDDDKRADALQDAPNELAELRAEAKRLRELAQEVREN